MEELPRQSEGPAVGARLARLKNSNEISVARVEKTGGARSVMRGSAGGRPRNTAQAIVGIVAPTLSNLGPTGGFGAEEMFDQVHRGRNYGESMQGNSPCSFGVNRVDLCAVLWFAYLTDSFIV